MKNASPVQAPQVTQLDDEPTGDCACGCGQTAYPFAVERLDGYVDAAPECAPAVGASALLYQSEVV